MKLHNAKADFSARHTSLAAISVDSPAKNAALATRLGVTFPLLSDPELATIRAWGVEHEGKGIARPTVVVLDTAGVVAWAYVGGNPGDRPCVADLIQVLDTLS